MTLGLKKLQDSLVSLTKVYLLWWLLATFPSLVLTFSYGSCVTFQGIDVEVDFFFSQILGYALFAPWICSSVLSNSKYVIYHIILALIICVIQLGALIVHIGILLSESSEFSDCVQVDFGGVYYTIVCNGGGVIIALLQVYYCLQLYAQLNHTKVCCFEPNDEV